MNFTHDKQPGKNFTNLAIVIVLHLIVGYAVVSGLGKRMVTKMAAAVETKLVDEVKPPPPKEVPPPPPPPEMKAPPPPFIPPPEVQVQQAPPPSVVQQQTNVAPASKVLDTRPPVVAAQPGPSKPSVTQARVDFNTCARPEYPKNSLRNEETGTTILLFTLAVDGHVLDSKIVTGSGFRDLDKAAQTALSKCVFVPGTRDGKPEQSTTKVQYDWKID